MPRSRNTIIAMLLVLALAASVVTAVKILTLPTVGSIRHQPASGASALSQLRTSLRAIGIEQADGAIQHLVSTAPSALNFRAATYWTSSDVDTRRDNDLAAGGTLALVLVLSALALGLGPLGRPAPARPT